MKKNIIDFVKNHLLLSFLILIAVILFILVLISYAKIVLFILLILLASSDGIVALASAIARIYGKKK